MDKIDFGGGGSPAGQRSTASSSNARKRKTARRSTTSSRGSRQGSNQRKITTPSPKPGGPTPTPQSAFFNSINLYPTNDPIGLHFVFDEATRTPIDEPSSVFHKECEVAALRVSDTITDPQTRRQVLESLLAAATLGLGGHAPNLSEGKQYFEFFKAHVVRASEDQRSPLIRELLHKSTYLIIASLLAIEIWAFATNAGAHDAAKIIFAQSGVRYAAVLNGVINILGIFGFALLGAVAGNLFFTLVRGRNVTFDNFDRLNPYRFSVNIHLTYLVLLVLVALLTLYFNVVTIGIGNLVLNDFAKNAPLAIVIGLVCALAEATLVTLIQGRIQSIAQPAAK